MHLIKYTLFSFILFNFCWADNWIPQQTPITSWLYRCDFVDSLHGWAVGDSGVIIATTNGGVTWVQQQTQTYDFLLSVTFKDKFTGWAIANNVSPPATRILKTTNGGLNWITSIYPDSNANITKLYYQDSTTMWMVGYQGYILRSTNDGNSWQRMQLDTSIYFGFPVRDMNMYSPSYGFACGGYYDYGGIIWRTTNYGFFWQSYGVASEPIFAMLYIDSLKVIGMGGDFEYGAIMVKTSDAGLNWEYHALNYFGIAQNIKMRTNYEFWSPLGSAQLMIYTIDTGKTWISINTTDSSGMYDLDFTDSLHGWAVGANGRILKYEPQPIGIEPNSELYSSNIFLGQNYPNPFNPSTNISFYLPRPSVVQIIIYDLNGREVKKLQLGHMPAGNKNIKFDASELASGVYFYTLNTGYQNVTKKMTVLK